MKRIYVVHPFGGKRSSKEAIAHICQRLVHFGVMPISPVHAFSFLNDNVPEQRKKALEFCEELVELCDEVWLFGEWEHSEGCVLERNVALVEMVPLYEVKGWDGDKPIFGKGGSPKWLKKIEGGIE